MTATLHVLAPPAVKPVGAVTAALGILRCLGASGHSLRLSEIVRDLGLNASTVLNILRTLEQEGLVAFDRRSKHYALAEGLVDLATPLLDRDRRIARAMKTAAQDLGATIARWRVTGDEVELIDVAESAAPVRIAFTLGVRVPMFYGAVGRLVAAHGDWSATTLADQFARVPWARRPDYATWLAEVDSARTAGAAIDTGHVNPGILGVAVPLAAAGPLHEILSAALFETDHRPDLDAVAARLRLVADC